MKTEQTPVCNSQEITVFDSNGQPYVADLVEADAAKRLERSRRANIRRAWRLRRNYQLYRKLYSDAVGCVMWMHEDQQIIDVVELGQCLMKTGIPALKEQRDEAQAQLADVTRQRDEAVRIAEALKYSIETEFDAWSIPCGGTLAKLDRLKEEIK